MLRIIDKKLSLCHKLWFYNLLSLQPNCFRPKILQPMSSVKSNNLSLKYQRFTKL